MFSTFNRPYEFTRIRNGSETMHYFPLQHPDYDAFTLENDHALIQLAEVPSGDNIASIFVDDVGGDNWVGSDCYITGWGDNGTSHFYDNCCLWKNQF